MLQLLVAGAIDAEVWVLVLCRDALVLDCVLDGVQLHGNMTAATSAVGTPTGTAYHTSVTPYPAPQPRYITSMQHDRCKPKPSLIAREALQLQAGMLFACRGTWKSLMCHTATDMIMCRLSKMCRAPSANKACQAYTTLS